MQKTEKDRKCEPPCSLACLVTDGVHHSEESLRAAATATIEDVIQPRIYPPGCNHCGQALPHAGSSWRESGACRRSQQTFSPGSEVVE